MRKSFRYTTGNKRIRRGGTTVFYRLWENPHRFLAGTFALLIAIGTILLSMPFSHAGQRVAPVDALFTSTSAVCVTGLIVKDTGRDFSQTGQVIILLLIQLGGLGIMTYGALIMQIAGSRMSLRTQLAMQDAFFQRNAANEYRRRLMGILFLTFTFEILGGMLLYSGMKDSPTSSRPAFDAVFHAVSAFCNAGFSTYAESMIPWKDNGRVLVTVMCLIVAGGLGHAVWLEISRRSLARLTGRQMPVRWTLQTRVVLWMTGGLIAGGAALFLLMGLGVAGSGGEKLKQALFMSITARTAGFNAMDMAWLPLPALLLIISLMFVGGSPGSCAGGVKTTSLAIWLSRLKARITHRDDVTLLGRRIPVELVRRTGLLIGVSAMFNVIGIMVLAVTEGSRDGAGLEAIFFEQISAFGTVGLSTGLTPFLSSWGKLWIIVSMFVGRIGPLTMAMAMVEVRPLLHRLPQENMMIG